MPNDNVATLSKTCSQSRCKALLPADEQHGCMGLNSHGVSKVSVIDAAGVKQVRAVIECLRQQMRELIELREE